MLYRMDISRMSRSISCLVVLLTVVCGTTAAGSKNGLYQARTFVTGQTEANRGFGFGQCLIDVLVKVSGDPRLIDDPGVAAMAGEAGTFVSAFRYRDLMGGIPLHDEQGTRDRPYELTVNFHPAKIDAALQRLGRKPWTASRPRIVVFLGVRHGTNTYTLTSDGDRGPGMREALAEAAERVGMPMALPGLSALAKAGPNFEKSPAPDLPSLNTMAKAVGGDVALAGSLVWSEEALGWIADWRLGGSERTYRWQIRGVNFDDAFRSAMRGAVQILSGHGQPAGTADP